MSRREDILAALESGEAGVARLAESTGYSDSTVRRVLRWLAEDGFITSRMSSGGSIYYRRRVGP